MFNQITMMNNRGQPYVSWKGTSANNVVPTWSRPLEGTETTPNGPDFKARPIKHWRKQLNPTPNSGNGKSAVGMPFNKPGSEVFLGKSSTSNCVSCSDSSASSITKSSNVAEEYNTFFTNAGDKFFDADKNKMVCIACNPEANIIKPASTLISKKYYSDRAAYLKSRCKTFTQNLSGNPVQGIQYLNGTTPVWASDSSTGSQVYATSDICVSSGTSTALIYKHSNQQYATQGAVDSSDRITRLKMNTINKNGASFATAYGVSAANAGSYSGAGTPYFIKSLKNQPNCVPVHRNGNKTIC
jgi:hypothetical protein